MMNIPLNIPAEPSVNEIPLFSNNSSPIAHTSPNSTPGLANRIPSIQIHSMSRSASTQASPSECDCPHILVADDEPFELFYYQHLFQRSLSLTTLNKKQLRVHTYSSGEDLIAFYKEYSTCECNSISLIITDYNMGSKNLDGVSTATILRQLGYKGHLVLRTSEAKEQLKKDHDGLEVLLEKKSVIYIDKSDLKNTKQILQDLIGN